MELPEPLIRLLAGLALLVPLSFPMRFLPSRIIRERYSLILALAIQYGVFGQSVIPVYIQHLITFAIIKLKGPKCGALVTLEAILFLSGYQIYLIINYYGQYSMSAENLVMILVCKYSLMAYNLQDGATDSEKLSK